jgi:hypothetical protein
MQEAKEKKEELEKVTDAPLSKYDIGRINGVWHGSASGQINGALIQICGTITGCGLLQIYGISNMFDNDISKEDFLKQLAVIARSSDEEMDAGSIIATLGKNHYHKEEKLLKLGFEKISEYINFRHDRTYKQRLYILKLYKPINEW